MRDDTLQEFARLLQRAAALLSDLASAPAATAVPAAPERLLTAKQMSEATGIPTTWFERQARERRIPHRRFGRRVRFSLDEVLEDPTFKLRAIPDTAVLDLDTGLRNRRTRKSIRESNR